MTKRLPVERVDVAGDFDADHDDETGDRLDDDGNDGGAPDATPGGPPGSGRRISKWDRPPDPHDWRFFVGNLGKVLIATGLLLFGFVAYQLWGTGIETARAQDALADQFEEFVAAAEPDGASPTDGDPVDAPIDTSVDGPVDGDAPDDGTTPPLAGGEASEIVPGATDLSDEAVEQEIPDIDRGDVVARLTIPSIDQDVYVVAGVSLNDLKDGPGHYPDTPLPGQLGNASIAGHRTTYGAPFFDVDQLSAGDEIVVTMITGDRFVYLVSGTEIVTASDYWVVTTRDPDVAELTLTSCHPKYTARDRIVVHSVLDPDRSSTVGVPTFYGAGDADEAEIPGDDPVIAEQTLADTDAPTPVETSADSPADSPVDSPVDSPADGGDGGAPDGGAEVPDGASAEAPSPPAEVDAFTEGWFDDRAAWPQIALWGTALIIISLLAYAVSRRFRHDSIGFLVGIAPFLFALYFFFQNVNRLLPPGL